MWLHQTNKLVPLPRIQEQLLLTMTAWGNNGISIWIIENWPWNMGTTGDLTTEHGNCTYVNMSIYEYIWVYTSSTAQGGGGSFKNRKPIGEVGCCESGMAERIHWWTERCLRSPLFLSLSLTIYPSVFYVSIYLSIYLSLSSNYLSIYPSIHLYIYLSLSLSFICLSV